VTQPREQVTREALAKELVELHEQLLARDTAFRASDERVAAIEREKEELAREMTERLDQAAAEIRSLSETIQAMQATRIWRLGERYWSVRDGIKILLRRDK
jgi:hypothetical protein